MWFTYEIIFLTSKNDGIFTNCNNIFNAHKKYEIYLACKKSTVRSLTDF